VIGVGVSLAFRAGVFNIGGEGQFALGAIAASVVGLFLPPLGGLSVAIALATAIIAGGAWAGVAAFLRARFGVLEVISTLMLNFVAANLVSYLVRGPLQEPSGIYPQSASIADAARLPHFSAGTRLHVGLLVAVGVAALAWWFLARTAAGFKLRAAGASPTAALVTGRVNVGRVAALALIASGALAGLAGGMEVSGVTYALYENLSPGYGFSAIAVAMLAGLHPVRVVLAALLFAVLETGALGMQRDADVPAVVANILEASTILAVLAASGRFSFKPWTRPRATPEKLAP
jgi:simple sugar transport system permease protein